MDRSRRDGVAISGLQRALEQRVTNPLLGWLLRSPLHRLVSRWVVLVAYEGRRSGDRFSFPALYHHQGDAVVVVTPRGESVWWANFREPMACRLRLRGRRRPATGTLVTGEARDRLLGAYLHRYRWLWRRVADDPEAAPSLAVVRFDLA